MSDVGHGPGWWLASDGRYYPPESHPDPEHRSRWAATEHDGQAPSEAPTTDLPTVRPTGEAPTTDLPTVSPLPDGPPTVPLVGDGPQAREAPGPSWPPAADDRAPTSPLPGLPAEVPVPPAAHPPSRWPEPTPPAPAPAGGGGNVAAGIVAGLAALAACAGTFLAWVEASTDVRSVERSGWHLGADGRITLVTGLAVAALAGAALAGVRHLALKALLGIGAVALLAVFVVELLDVLDLRDALPEASVSVGPGLWLVGAAGVLLAVAAAVERARIRVPRR